MHAGARATAEDARATAEGARATAGGTRTALWALVGYLALSLLVWGRFVLGDFGSESLAANDGVPSAFMWLLEWWPHALLNATNPFWTHDILVPEGVNLTWVTSVPGLSLAFAPITLAFGPVVSWNVIVLLAPALSAWTAFLLCRQVTHATAPSLVGGVLFGFSPYVVRHLDGLPQLSFVAFVPLILLLVVCRMDGTIGERTFVAGMAVALAAQFSISTEVLLTTVLLGVLILGAAFLTVPERRAALIRLLKLMGAALVGMAILVSPFALYALVKPHTAPDYTYFGARADLLAFVVPNQRLQAISFGSHDYAQGFGYVGVPLLVLLVLFARESWRTTRGKLILIGLGIAAIASLGGSLRVATDKPGIPLPWGLVDWLPLVKYALPVRLSLYVFLAAALAVAVWLATRPSVARWALAAIALLAVAPNVLGATDWTTRAVDPAFFSSDQYRRYLSPDDRVLAIPAVGASMRWQANTKFAFKLVGGGFASYGRRYTDYPIWIALVFGQPNADAGNSLYKFTHDHHVNAVVVDKTVPGHWRSLMGTLGARPRDLGGVLYYRLGKSGLPLSPRVVGGSPGEYTIDEGSIRSAQRTYRIVTANPSGYLDGDQVVRADVLLGGWTGFIRKGHPARKVVVFSGSRLVAVAKTGVRRPDLRKLGTEYLNSGFRATVPLRTIQDRGTRPPLRAFALDDLGNAMELKVSCHQQYVAC